MGKRIALFPRVGYQTEEPQKLLSSVLELMLLVAWNENYIASAERRAFCAVEELSFAFKYEDFVFPLVRVQGTVPAGFHFEEAHGEVFCSDFLGDEPAYRGFGGASFGVLGFYSVVVEYFHVLASCSVILVWVLR
jgi:hypothetical protein